MTFTTVHLVSSSIFYSHTLVEEKVPVPYSRNVVQRRREGRRTVDIQTLPADGNSVFRFY